MSKQVYTIITVLVVLAVGWLLVSTVTSSDQPSDSQTATTWQTYENSRFGYKLEVPTSFTVQDVPQNNDGRVFVNPSGSTTVRVYGRNNTNNDSISDVVSEQTKRLDSLRDAHVGSSSAILYGSSSGQRQTTKLLHSPDTIAVMQIAGSQRGLTEDQRMRLTESFSWSTNQQNDSQSQATTTPDRPVSYTPQAAEDLIRVDKPSREATISSPLEVAGEARGQWFFEADAPVVLVDWDGRIIAEGYIQAEGDPADESGGASWMTEEFVPFSGTLEFDVPEDTGTQSIRGSLILQRANPSGQPENDMAVEIPVRFQR